MDAIAALYGTDSSSDEDAAATADKHACTSVASYHASASSGSSDEDSKSEDAGDGYGGGDDGEQKTRRSAPTRKRRRDEESKPQWKRAFVHVDGNWPSHVKVDIPVGHEVFSIVHGVVSEAQRALGDELTLVPMMSNAREEADHSGLHLSLSRPFVLTFNQIDAFVDTLRSALKWRTRFRVSLGRAIVLVNDDATRSFLALQVATGASQFVSLVKCIDKCMREFGLATYYEDPIPHVSIASAFGDSLRLVLPPAQLDQLLPASLEDDETCAFVQVTSVQVVIGNKHFRIPLR